MKLPTIPSTIDLEEKTREYIDPIKEIVEVREGRRPNVERRERAVTLGMLLDLGLITEAQMKELSL